MYDLLITNGKLVTPDRIYDAQIAVKDGKFAGFFAPGETVEAAKTVDAGGNLVYPGIIDCHAHLNTAKILKQAPGRQFRPAARR